MWVVRVAPSFDPELTRGVIEAVAGGGRAPRRLAKAVLGRPEVLADGRSLAPLVISPVSYPFPQAGGHELLSSPRPMTNHMM